MTRKLRIGYIPLLDSALIHIAAHKGMAEAEDLQFELVRETSWANLRDKLALRILDGAHMLAPAAIASSLGLSQVEAPLVAPVALGLDGNAITLSLTLHAALMAALEGDPSDPVATAKALAQVMAARQARGQPPLSLAHVFPFSSHHYQLRLWLTAGGINPEADLRLVVVPPPFMAKSLGEGLVDGFCVGAPWNSIAEQAGVGRVLHPCCDIVRNCPEKVLAFRAGWTQAKPDLLDAAARAIASASVWANAPENLAEVARLLAHHVGFDIGEDRIVEILTRGANRQAQTPLAWLRLDPAATHLAPSQALWLFDHMVAAGQTSDTPTLRAKAAATYQPRLRPTDAAAGPCPPPLQELPG